ncbi:MAG: ribbon-helix-helix protein, CopG family [Promethearchaeota archaeon]
MTVINIHIKDKDKKKLQKHIKNTDNKSMSEFIRKVVSEKIELENLISKTKNEQNISVKIPDYIPKNKYVIFVKGAVVGVGDNPSDLSQIAIEKFPNLPFEIKFNGTKKKPIEYCFMSLSKFNAWHYGKFEERTYPIIPVKFLLKKKELKLSAIIDTAASLCILKKGEIPLNKLKQISKEKMSTAAGIIDVIIYSGKVMLLDTVFNIDFIIAPIADILPFKFLMGRNLLDRLDAYFFGRKQVVLLKLAE